jgi:hypothetical protein
MFRNILAVVAGYFALAVLTVLADSILASSSVAPQTDFENLPTGWLLLILAYSLLFAIVGGCVTGFLSRGSGYGTVVALACLLLLMSVMNMFAHAGKQPAWFHLTLAIIGVAGVLSGGKIVAMRKDRHVGVDTT